MLVSNSKSSPLRGNWEVSQRRKQRLLSLRMFRNHYWTCMHVYNQTRIRIREGFVQLGWQLGVRSPLTASGRSAIKDYRLRLHLLYSHLISVSFPYCEDQSLCFSFLDCEQAPAERVWTRLEGLRKNWVRVKWLRGGGRSSPFFSLLSAFFPLSLHPSPLPPPPHPRLESLLSLLFS